MKHLRGLIVLTAVMLVSMSCEIFNLGGKSETEEQTHRITAVTEAQSRLSLDGGNGVVWSSSDELLVIPTAENQTEGVGLEEMYYQLVEGAGSTTGVFEKTIDEAFETYSAFYPTTMYEEITDENQLIFKLPYSNATLLERNISNNGNPMYATGVNGNKLRLRNLCGILEIQVMGSGALNSIRIEADQPIAGYFMVQDGLPTLNKAKGFKQYNYVEGVVSPNIKLSKQSCAVYAILPPGTYDYLQITTRDTDSNTTTITIDAPVVINRSHVTTIPTFVHNETNGSIIDPEEKPEIDWK